MRATIRERRVMAGLASASSLEHVGDSFYIVGDDSPFLFRLDAAHTIVGTTSLFEFELQDRVRIAKGLKPDLEAMCTVEWQGRRELLCFGSGSRTPERDVCFRVDVTDTDTPRDIRRVGLTALYDTLRENPEIVGTHRLNIEAASSTVDSLLLFQRGNISGLNTVLEFGLAEFMAYLDVPQPPAPLPSVIAFSLPIIQGRRAGFSAATTFRQSVLFAAAIENTDNEIDDGDKLGSFIGRIQGDVLEWIAPVVQDGEIAPVKIEGISVLKASEDFVELAAVTDNDEGESELLRIEVS